MKPIFWIIAGWCEIERGLSGVLKAANRRSDISKYHGFYQYSYNTDTVCATGTRAPPLLPEHMARVLANEKKFYASSDVEVVAALYASFFDVVVPVQEALVFAKLGWTCKEAELLGVVLPRFCRIKHLDLSRNKIGPLGGKAIGEVLALSASLANLNLYSNKIGTAGGIALADALRVNASLTSLNLADNEIGPGGGVALADALRVNATLTEVLTFCPAPISCVTSHRVDLPAHS